jgi:hypothetical protein
LHKNRQNESFGGFLLKTIQLAQTQPMRFKLLARRLTVSAPRMAVRSHLPWPFRWVAMAIMLGLCAAIGLWAFEFGKRIAGLDTGARQELDALRSEVQTLRAERNQAQSVLNTSSSLMTSEKAAQEQLLAQLRKLEADNRALRDDLGFFEKLIPSGGDSLAIRSLQGEMLATGQLRWQILVLQPGKNAPEFKGKLEITLAGQLAGKPWNMAQPGGSQTLVFKQYRRLEGLVDIPPGAVVKNVSAKVLEGASVRAVQVSAMSTPALSASANLAPNPIPGALRR